LWPTGGDTFLGAFDQGEIFCWRPGESPQATGAFIPSPRGRRFLARWTAACCLDDVVFGATSDGYVFEYDPSSRMVRNLGKPSLSLGIRDLTADGDQIFGIAGRADDVCSVFGYTRRMGFIDYGTDVAGSMDLSVLICLGNGKVAVAEDARIAHVNVYDLGRVDGIRPSDPEGRSDGGDLWNRCS
jgi:hypothetical protein